MRQGKHVNEHGAIRYYKDGLLHRDDDLPAAEYVYGGKRWYQNGKLHRLTGPAWIFGDIVKYYINDIHLTKEEHANHPEVKKYKLQQVLNRVLEEQIL